MQHAPHKLRLQCAEHTHEKHSIKHMPTNKFPNTELNHPLVPWPKPRHHHLTVISCIEKIWLVLPCNVSNKQWKYAMPNTCQGDTFLGTARRDFTKHGHDNPQGDILVDWLIRQCETITSKPTLQVPTTTCPPPPPSNNKTSSEL